MSYVLYSTPVKLRKMEVMVPPISMYHMRKLLELRDSGVDLDNPDGKGLEAIVRLLHEVVQENHPELGFEQFEREVDASNLREIMMAVQGIPKNVTAQTGMMTQPESPQETSPAQS